MHVRSHTNPHDSQSITLYVGGWTRDQIIAEQCANRIVNRAREYRRLFGVDLTALGYVIRQEVEKTINGTERKETKR